MPSISIILVTTFSLVSLFLVIASLSSVPSAYKNNRKLYIVPAMAILFFLAALFCGLTCACKWISSSSNFCSFSSPASAPSSSPAPSPSSSPAPAPSPSSSPTPAPQIQACVGRYRAEKCSSLNGNCTKHFEITSPNPNNRNAGADCKYSDHHKKCKASNTPCRWV